MEEEQAESKCPEGGASTSKPTVKAHIYFVRHGETVANREGILQGVSADYPLTEDGHEQAHRTGHFLKDDLWDVVLTSDLPRAVKTCERILTTSTHTGPAKETHLLREISFGIRENFPKRYSVSEVKQLIAEQKGIHVDAITDHAELPDNLLKRQEQFFEHVLSNLMEITDEPGKSVKKVLCVSHGGFIKSLIRNFCNTDMGSVGNCSISIMEVEWEIDVPILKTVTPVKLHVNDHL